MKRYATPFTVRDSVIYDAEGKKVKLWGVNYYTPFNSNFYNIESSKTRTCAFSTT